MKTRPLISLAAPLLCAVLLVGLSAAGCGGGGQPKVMVFLGQSSQSYPEMKPVVDKLEKQYEGKVTWVNVDYDDPANKKELEKYHVSMNPTVIIFNKEGKVKETFMGAAREDMLAMSIESYLPAEERQPSSSPGEAPPPTGGEPGQGAPGEPIPGAPVPGTPGSTP